MVKCCIDRSRWLSISTCHVHRPNVMSLFPLRKHMKCMCNNNHDDKEQQKKLYGAPIDSVADPRHRSWNSFMWNGKMRARARGTTETWNCTVIFWWLGIFPRFTLHEIIFYVYSRWPRIIFVRTCRSSCVCVLFFFFLISIWTPSPCLLFCACHRLVIYFRGSNSGLLDTEIARR